jgi:hypothetical protein
MDRKDASQVKTNMMKLKGMSGRQADCEVSTW